MQKNINSNKEIVVRKSGVQSLSNCTPSHRPKCEKASFFVINTKTLQELGANQLSFYYKLKTYYSNGCFYNYSVNKIAKLIGVSHATAKKNISKLIESNLISINNGNLCLKKIKRGTCNRKVFISSKFSLNQIKDKLLLLLIERKNNQMKHGYRKANSDLFKSNTSDSTEFVGESLSNAIGVRKLSSFLKVSPSYLSHFTKRMIKSKRLKVNRVKINLGKVFIQPEFISNYLYKDKLGNTILYKGSVYSL